LIKKRPYLKDETERLYQFIKEYHAVVTKRYYEYFGFPQISKKITPWLNDTYIKYNVNLAAARKKKSLEILMMFTWLGEVSGEDAEFFQNYLSEFKEYLLPTDQGVGSSNLLTHVQKTFV